MSAAHATRTIRVGTAVGDLDAVATGPTAGDGGGIVRALGVPYAERPVGAARFRPARRRGRFADAVDARHEGATAQCGQPFPSTVIPEPSIPGDDILQLGITAPADGVGAGAALPVLVWIHGGGYVAGSPASPWYDGAAIARTGAVVVRIGYRLGVEGFGLVDGDANRGLGDMLVALDWVRECIDAFGGDASRITLAGQSAGGGAVLALLASPATGPLAGAVSISGIDLSSDAVAAAAETTAIAARLGLDPTAEALATADRAALQAAHLAHMGDESRLLGPVHGTALLPSPVADGLAQHGLDVPLLLGSTADEFDCPADPTVPEGHRTTDRLFRSVVPRVAAARRGGAGTWLYSFDWPSPTLGGAGHCIDLPFLFDALDAPGVPEVCGAAPPQRLADAMAPVLLDVVHGRSPAWPPAASAPGDPAMVFTPAATAELRLGRYDAVIA